MTLAAGSRLGSYEIVSPLGAGGMGEVYRARDPRLSREVAIKVLPAALCADASRLKRFEKEARAASALNHPNIVTIHEVGASDSTPYLVMELVAGKTLREILAAGPLAVRRLLAVAVQIAEGLARAHAAGLVHRDVKPENVMVNDDGLVKILDFGLAKLTEPETAGDPQTRAPTLSAMTEPGVVLGTLAYMSPEQASGSPLDFRSDQFSFGSVLYEMATGRPAFQGRTRPETLAAIIREEPEPITALAPKTPAPLRWIVERCLAKEPRERYASTDDLAREIRSLRDHVSEIGASPEDVSPPPARPRRLRFALATGGLVAALAVGFLSGRWLGKADPPHPTFQRLTFRRGIIEEARFAPDGQTIVFAAAWEGNPSELFSTRAGASESRPLGLGRASMRAISSQGDLAFILRGEGAELSGPGLLARAPLSGGAPRELLENIDWADWSPDGKQLAIVRDVEGRSRLEYPPGKVLHETIGARRILAPRISADGARIAFIERLEPTAGNASIAIVDLSGKKKTISSKLYDELSRLAWSPRGDEIWFSADRLDEVRPSLFALTLSGAERLVYSAPVGLRLVDVSRDGRLLVVSLQPRFGISARAPGQSEESDLSWLDRSFANDLTADGTMLLINEEGEGGGPKETVYIRRTDGSPAVRLGEGWATSLTPDGKWALTIPSGGSPIVLLPTGAGEAKTLPYTGKRFLTGRFLPDGRRLLLIGTEAGHAERLYVGDREGGPLRAISSEGVNASGLCVSPDGTVAAAVGPDRVPRIYPIGGGSPRPIRAARAGDLPVRFGSNGRELYVVRLRLNSAEIHRIDLESGRRELWKELAAVDRAGYSPRAEVQITPDGKHYAYTYRRVLSDLFLVEGLK